MNRCSRLDRASEIWKRSPGDAAEAEYERCVKKRNAHPIYDLFRSINLHTGLHQFVIEDTLRRLSRDQYLPPEERLRGGENPSALDLRWVLEKLKECDANGTTTCLLMEFASKHPGVLPESLLPYETTSRPPAGLADERESGDRRATLSRVQPPAAAGSDVGDHGGDERDREPAARTGVSAGPPAAAKTEQGEGGRKRRVPADEAEIRVREWLLEHAKDNPTAVTRDAVAAGTGVSKGQVSKTAAWKAFKERRDAGTKPGAREVPLTETMQATIPADCPRSDELAELIEEQQQEAAKDARRHKRRHKPS
jgi:hypothetical protein